MSTKYDHSRPDSARKLTRIEFEISNEMLLIYTGFSSRAITNGYEC